MTALEDDVEHRYFRDAPADPLDGPELDALARAGWHLRRLGRLEHELATVEAVYRAEMDRLTLRFQTRRAILEAAIAWHEAPLKSYMAMRLDADGIKTLELPNGTIRTRTPTKPSLLIDDPAAVAQWASDVLPDVVTYRPQINKGALTAYVHASGEIPPGVTIVPPATSITITPEGGGE